MNKENGPNSTRDGALNRAYLLAAPMHVCSGPMQLRASTLADGGGVNVIWGGSCQAWRGTVTSQGHSIPASAPQLCRSRK